MSRTDDHFYSIQSPLPPDQQTIAGTLALGSGDITPAYYSKRLSILEEKSSSVSSPLYLFSISYSRLYKSFVKIFYIIDCDPQ